MKDGLGVFVFANNNGSYEGEWKNNCFNGKGTMKWPDGSQYKGTYKMNRYGDGIYITSKGKEKKVTAENNPF